MSVCGIGCDLTRVSRVMAVFNRHGERFLQRILHPVEYKAFTMRSGHRQSEYLASCWAVKEAAYKAVSRHRLAFPDIVYRSDPSRRPSVEFVGEAQMLLSGEGAPQAHVSVTHDGDLVFAHVLVEQTQPR